MEHFFWNRQPIIISNHEQTARRRDAGKACRLLQGRNSQMARDGVQVGLKKGSR